MLKLHFSEQSKKNADRHTRLPCRINKDHCNSHDSCQKIKMAIFKLASAGGYKSTINYEEVGCETTGADR